MPPNETGDVSEERIATRNRSVEIEENEARGRLAWIFEIVHASL
jgi:deoxyadenosine/deoxycytidine kinase